MILVPSQLGRGLSDSLCWYPSLFYLTRRIKIKLQELQIAMGVWLANVQLASEIGEKRVMNYTFKCQTGEAIELEDIIDQQVSFT